MRRRRLRPSGGGKSSGGDRLKTTFTCRSCGTLVSRKPSEVRARYCSPKCYYDTGKIHHQRCRNCGVKFSSRNIRLSGCCSDECRKARMVARKSRVCAWCGESFTLFYPSVAHRFCSLACSNKSRTKPDVEIKCTGCGSLFRVPSGRKARKYCSKECGVKFRVGVNHPCYRGAKRPGYRGTNWKVQSGLARIRDGKLCRGCGEPSHETLSVDHIVAYRLAAKIAEENSLDPNDLRNLISLCRVCHSKKTHIEVMLLEGNVIGFISRVKVIIPEEIVLEALGLWGFWSVKKSVPRKSA